MDTIDKSSNGAMELVDQQPDKEPERYRLVFDGTIAFTADPEETKERLAQLFRCDRPRVEQLFTGTVTVLKKGLDREAALKMKEAFDRTGALCTMELEEAPAAAAPPQQPTLQAPQEANACTTRLEQNRSFTCPKCGYLQEPGESCAACGVFFAKVAELAARDIHGFRDTPNADLKERSHSRGIDMPRARANSWLRRMRFSTPRAKAAGIISLLVLGLICLFIIDNASDVDQNDPYAKLANSALKRQFDLGKPDVYEIQRLLSAHDFKSIEKVYDGYQEQYKVDVAYEGILLEAYKIFSPKYDLSEKDLDLWVQTTGSYIAYAARGMYKAEQGFITRGEESINNTPQSNIDEMQRLHDEAAKDLQMAVATNPYVMPAYTSLMVMARTSSMPFSATDILKKAEASDDRTYFVRQEYMVSLQPRWGGSHEAMKEFAKSVIQYNDRNPRLWSLQGAADADRAYSHYQAGNFSAAVRYYTKALRFGDRFPWLEYRAASCFYLGKKDKAVNDYKQVLYYDPTETKSLAGARGEEP